jgi:hypothetical protein
MAVALIALLAQCHGGAVYAEESEVSADDEVAAGELGSLEDDAPVPSGRRARGTPPAAPRFVIDPSARIAAVHHFTKDFSAEVYARGQLGANSDPLTTRSTVAASGLILNNSFNGLVWSNSIESGAHYHDFYDRRSFNANELTTAFSRPIKLSDPAWTVTPRVSIGYRWTDNDRFEHSKIELMAPVSYKISDKTELSLMSRIDWQTYTRRADGRRDMTGYVAAGVKQAITKTLSANISLGYETRASNVSNSNHTRLKLAPQLNLRAEF